MKLACSLFALTLIAVAGAAFAAQSAAPVDGAQVTHATQVATPAQEPIVSSELDGLLAPTDMVVDPLCPVYCQEEQIACFHSCSLNDPDCFDFCTYQYSACIASC